MLRKTGGDLEMVDVLALVLHHDEKAVLTVVKMALEAGGDQVAGAEPVAIGLSTARRPTDQRTGDDATYSQPTVFLLLRAARDPGRSPKHSKIEVPLRRHHGLLSQPRRIRCNRRRHPMADLIESRLKAAAVEWRRTNRHSTRLRFVLTMPSRTSTASLPIVTYGKATVVKPGRRPSENRR